MYYRLAELYIQVGDLIEIKGIAALRLVGVCIDVNVLGRYREYTLFSEGRCYYYTDWHDGRIVSAFDKTI